jgi:sulfur transfer complex TusBCD TusB component (DsrH family)
LEEAVETTFLVLTAAPSEPRTASCLGLARALRQAGKDVEVLLLQDAVLLATHRPAIGWGTSEIPSEGVRFLVLEDDLRLRGFRKGDLTEPAALTTYRAAIRRMADEGVSVKGCF